VPCRPLPRNPDFERVAIFFWLECPLLEKALAISRETPKMKRTVFEFPRARSRRRRVQERRLTAGATSIELLKMVDDLRSDLRSIENAIMAVECLAAAEFGEDALRARKPAFPKRASTPPSKSKIRPIGVRYSPQRQFESLTAGAKPPLGQFSPD